MICTEKQLSSLHLLLQCVLGTAGSAGVFKGLGGWMFGGEWREVFILCPSHILSGRSKIQNFMAVVEAEPAS